MKPLALFFCLFLPSLLAAQSFCDYDKLYREGKAFAKKRQYKMALYKFNSARRCDPSKGEPVDAAIEALLAQIEGEKRTADRERKRAEEALHQADLARLRSDSLYDVADTERRRTEAVLDKIYFYKGNFGLAYDKTTDRYGFIDKQLNTKIDFQYEEALPFEYTGYAKVKKNDDRYYLIDTTGTEFLLATDVNKLDSAITALDLRSNNLSQIPDVVFSQAQLKILLLNNNQLDTLPVKMRQLKNLQSLDLQGNDSLFLVSVCKVFCNFSKPIILSTRLYLNYDKNKLLIKINSQTHLPIEIGQLNNLQSLDLSGNGLTSLPAEIAQLNNLQSLDISGNELETLPSEIGQLTSLRSLNLGFNPIFSLPTEIGQLENLQSFDFSGNRKYPHGELDGDMITKNWLKLRKRSRRLLQGIDTLKSLQMLNLSHNGISYLNFDIGQLTNLQTLLLSWNELNTLPPEILNLKSLTYIDLRSNPISPEYIEQLRKDMPWCEIQF